jgi:hypothetical protein
MFIITSQNLTKVKCPNCATVNQLVTEGNPAASQQASSYSGSRDPVPVYSIHDVSRIARGLLDESTSFWVEVTVPHVDGIDSCYKRVYGYDRDRQNEVYVTKAKAYINAPMRVVHNVYWNKELDWDSSTVGMIKYYEDNVNNRLILKEHKTTSAATLRNDLVVRAVYEEYNDHVWYYATSETYPTLPEKGGWRRGHLVLQGCLVTELDNNRCEVSFINCFDFGGWIHVKFIDEEQKKVAGRLSRIKKRAEDDYKLEISKSQQSYHQHLHEVKQQQKYEQQLLTGQSEQQTSGSFTYNSSAVCNVCPSCKNVSTSKFCGNDGSPLELSCSQCYNPVRGNNKFCATCGAKLIV